MAYVPKRLFVGRCVRCGKPLYRADEMYRCVKDNIVVCPICYRKTYGRCPICGVQLTPSLRIYV
ncbi:MAG: hypothetical protein DRJ32_03900 [Thermoprotei archaeon]|nr:MAG: hypothetical protein DRJ32_03900 [Thermoprotei archaeon]